MFVTINSNITSSLVGSFTICFNKKCLHKAENGHLLKSPTRKTPAFGYFASAMTNFVDLIMVQKLIFVVSWWIVSDTNDQTRKITKKFVRPNMCPKSFKVVVMQLS